MEKRPLRKRIKYTALYYFIRFLIFSSNITPRKAWLRFCGVLGRIAYIFSPKPVERMIRHLTIAFGKEKSPDEIKKLSKKTFTMLGKNAGDILRSLSVKSLDDLNRFLVTTGIEHYEEAHAK